MNPGNESPLVTKNEKLNILSCECSVFRITCRCVMTIIIVLYQRNDSQLQTIKSSP